MATTTRKRKVTQVQATKVLNLVAEWMGKQGYGVIIPCGKCVGCQKHPTALREWEWACDKPTFGPAPTGPEAATRGEGPMLIMDWDWSFGGPIPTVILEGGPYDWAISCSYWVQERCHERGIPVFVEPYSGWALCLYREN